MGTGYGGTKEAQKRATRSGRKTEAFLEVGLEPSGEEGVGVSQGLEWPRAVQQRLWHSDPPRVCRARG